MGVARNDVERVEVSRQALAELMDLAARASMSLEFADPALSEGLTWAIRETRSDLMQPA